ncbi:MAG TPA: hypothetical protein VIA29_00955 [Thermoanaerobaculia bacterium]
MATTVAQAEDLHLDSNFGEGGILYPGSTGVVVATILEPDGRILTGETFFFQPLNFRASLRKCLADGSPDPSFGTSSSVTIGNWTGLSDVERRPDGAILALGRTGLPGEIRLARFHSNGVPDGTFGSGGQVALTFGGDPEYGFGLLLQPDGRLLVLGRTQTATGERPYLARRLSDGSPDPSFGTAGIIFGDSASPFLHLALDSSGRILVGSTRAPDSSTRILEVIRYDSTGTPDASFGTAGVASANLGRSIGGMALDSTGVLVTGWAEGLPLVIARFTEQGVLDPSFGNAGSAEIGAPDEYRGYPLSRTGGILVTGLAERGTFDPLVVLALTADGDPDPTFGVNGRIEIPLQLSAVSVSAAFSSDGTVLVLGGAYQFLWTVIALARLVSCAPPGGAPPAVTGVMPAAAPAGEAVELTIEGNDFTSGAAVELRDRPVDAIVSLSPGEIVVDTFPEAFGMADVIVRNPDCLVGELEDAVYFYPSDAAPGHLFYDFVRRVVLADVTAGCDFTLYCTDSPVLRSQMAVFLLRSRFGPTYEPPPATGTVFLDVGVLDFAAAWIEELYELGITDGCGPQIFCPLNPVSREQMAVFLLATREGTGYDPPPATGIFDDVPITSIYAAWIEELSRRGITAGCAVDLYCPERSVTRGEMAVFLAETFSLPL